MRRLWPLAVAPAALPIPSRALDGSHNRKWEVQREALSLRRCALRRRSSRPCSGASYGFSGYLPFGYVGFFGAGAYGFSMLVTLAGAGPVLAVVGGLSGAGSASRIDPASRGPDG